MKILGVVICGLFLAASVTTTQTVPAAREPLGDSQQDRLVTALGGREALMQTQSVDAEGSIELNGRSGGYRLRARADGAVRIDIDLEVVQVVRAFNGILGWEQQGERIRLLTGTGLEDVRGHAIPSLLAIARGADARPATTLGDDGRLRELVTDKGLSSERIDRLSDYRRVNALLLPHSIETRRGDRVQRIAVAQYRIGTDLPDSLFADPAGSAEALGIELSTVPRRVFKENTGVWEENSNETWVFHVAVEETRDQLVRPTGARLVLYQGDTALERIEYGQRALEERLGQRFTGQAALREVFDIRHALTRPISMEVDRMTYELDLLASNGTTLVDTISILVARYNQKTRLTFPLRGHFMVTAGHAPNEAHKEEWSQHYADDIVALTDDLAIIGSGNGTQNADFVTWGAEVIAPAPGTVVYARADMPDNTRPGEIDVAAIRDAPDRRNAIGGNNVVIDHGNDEYSFLAHMIEGSVRVQIGDRVTRGQVLGLAGNSGNSDGPHLHYHLMAGREVFRSDGLPARFDNVYLDLETGDELVSMPSPRRGMPLLAQTPRD